MKNSVRINDWWKAVKRVPKQGPTQKAVAAVLLVGEQSVKKYTAGKRPVSVVHALKLLDIPKGESGKVLLARLILEHPEDLPGESREKILAQLREIVSEEARDTPATVAVSNGANRHLVAMIEGCSVEVDHALDLVTRCLCGAGPVESPGVPLGWTPASDMLQQARRYCNPSTQRERASPPRTNKKAPASPEVAQEDTEAVTSKSSASPRVPLPEELQCSLLLKLYADQLDSDQVMETYRRYGPPVAMPVLRCLEKLMMQAETFEDAFLEADRILEITNALPKPLRKDAKATTDRAREEGERLAPLVIGPWVSYGMTEEQYENMIDEAMSASQYYEDWTEDDCEDAA